MSVDDREFVLARIAEERAAAEAAGASARQPVAWYVARWSPARVLRWCSVLESLLLVTAEPWGEVGNTDSCIRGWNGGTSAVVADLAALWSDHPDYACIGEREP